MRKREKVQEVPRGLKALVFPCLVSGLFYGLSFPPIGISIIAWFALTPLLREINERRYSPRELFAGGLLCGGVANAIVFFWLWKTFLAAGINIPTTFAIWILLSLLLALYFSFFFVLYARLANNAARPFLAAAVWVGLETVRLHVLTGFPWALLGHTQAGFVSLIQLSALVGAGGVSFVLILFSAAISDIKSRPRVFLGVLFFVIAVCVWGTFRVRQSKNPERTIKVALLQGDIDQYQKWDASYEAGIRRTYEALITQAVKYKPDLIVWPESAVPGWYPNDPHCLDWVNSVVHKSGTSNLVGAVTNRTSHDYNAAFYFNATGALQGEYDKQHMVPFGEYIPFGGFLKSVIPYLGQLGTFDGGDAPVLFKVGEAAFAPNICYEAIFPSLVRHSVDLGADFIVNVTNDGWFLNTGAPAQHFAANVFRAVENGRPLVRAANTGISGAINAFGQLQVRSSSLVGGVYLETIELPLNPMRTIYSRGGFLFDYVCLAAALLWFIFHLIYSKHVTRAPKPN